MKKIYRLLCIAAVMSVAFACQSVPEEGSLEELSAKVEKGVHCYLPAIEFDTPETKVIDFGDKFTATFDENDKIGVWPYENDYGQYQTYTLDINTDNTANARFEGGAFVIAEGSTYTSIYPRLWTDEWPDVPISFEGQIQTGNGTTAHLKNYLYAWASATCVSGSTTFNYEYNAGFIQFVLTFNNLETATSFKEVKLIADSNVFAVNPTLDVKEGNLSKGTLTSEISIALKNLSVEPGGTMTVNMAAAPFASCKVRVNAIADDNTVYTSTSGTISALNPGKAKRLSLGMAEMGSEQLIDASLEANEEVKLTTNSGDLYVSIVQSEDNILDGKKIKITNADGYNGPANLYLTVVDNHEPDYLPCNLALLELTIDLPNTHVVLSAAAEEEIGTINTITSLNTLVLGEKITVGSVAIQEHGGGLTVDGKITGTLTVPNNAAADKTEPEKIWVKINESAEVGTISVEEPNCNLYIAGKVGTVTTSAARTTVDGNIATALTANASAEVVVTSNGSVADATVTANGQSEVYIVEGADIEGAILKDNTTTSGVNTGSIVSVDEPVAEVNGVEYMTFAKALAMVPTNGVKTTVKLLTDVALAEGFTVAATQNMVLDLNGFTLSEVLSQSGTSALITNNGTLVIQDKTDASANGSGTGKITYNNGNPDQASVPGYASNTIINQGNLTINSGYIENTTTGGYAAYTVDNLTNGGLYTPTFTMNGGKLYNNYTDAVRMSLNSDTNLNKVVINGGILDSDKASGRVIVMHNPNAKANKGELDITGGTILGMVNAWSAANAGSVEDRFSDAQYEAVKIEISGGAIDELDFESMANTTLRASSLIVTGGTYKVDPSAYVSAGYIATQTDDIWTVDGPYVARIGATGYTTLEAAVAAASEGATIDLLQDIQLTSHTTTVNGVESEKYSIAIEKGLTINGNGHSITATSQRRAIALAATGKTITLKDLSVRANGSTAMWLIADNMTVTLDNTVVDGTGFATGSPYTNDSYNQVITIGSGITGTTLNVTHNSIVKTNDAANSHYAIIAWSPSIINVDHSTLKGYAAVYVKPSASGTVTTVSDSDVESHGYSGLSNAFGMFVTESGNNTFTLTSNDYRITAGDQYQVLTELNGTTGNVVKLLGTSTFTPNDPVHGTLTSSWGEYYVNSLYMDDANKETFANFISSECNVVKETSGTYSGLWKITGPSPEIYYYWDTTSGQEGTNCDLEEPFVKKWLCDGEYIDVLKNITLNKTIACQLTSGSFRFNLGEYTVTKGDYSITLKTGVSVVTDKPTDIFTAAAEGAAIAVTAGTGTYTYTAVAAVAQIGSTRYASLAAAIAAVPTDGTKTTIQMLADETMATEATLTVAANQNVVLDLNGKTVSGSHAANASFYFITNKGTLEITDTSSGNNGKITSSWSNANYSYECVTVYNLGGTLTLSAGKVETTSGGLGYAINNSSNAWGVGDDKESVFNMTGGTLNAPAGDAALRVYQNCGGYATPLSHNRVNISGGTIATGGIFLDETVYTGNANPVGDGILTNVTISGGEIHGLIDLKMRHSFNTTFHITGGTFVDAKLWIRKHSEWHASVAEPTAPIFFISGGNFSFVNNMAFGLAYDCAGTSWSRYTKPYSITGGTFNVDPSAFCALGYAATGTGPWTVGVMPNWMNYAASDAEFAAATSGTEISISSAALLAKFAKNVNEGVSTYNGYTIKLTADIDLAGKNWTPVGVNEKNGDGAHKKTFEGTFEGNNKTISNLYCYSTEDKPLGLFGFSYAGPSYIQNLTLSNVFVYGVHQVGAIIGNSINVHIDNCKVSGGSVTTTPRLTSNGYDDGNQAGGIAGQVFSVDWHASGLVSNCTVEDLTIKAYRDVGGIAGCCQNGDSGNSPVSITGNTVKNCTVIADQTSDYVEAKPFNANDIVGRYISGTVESNTYTNVTVQRIAHQQ